MNPEVFIKAGVLDREELDHVQKEKPGSSTETFCEKLIRLGYCSEEEIAKALALYHGIEYLDLRRHAIDPGLTASVPASIAVQKNLIPVGCQNGELILAVSDPTDVATVDLVAFVTGKRVRLCTASATVITETVRSLYGVSEHQESLADAGGAKHTVEILERELLTGSDLQRLQSTSDKTAIVRLVDSIIYQSIMKRASDIHIEPQDGSVAVRNRIDGVLHDLLSLPGSIQPVVTSRLKIMAGMDIAERRVPQDGRIKVRVSGRVIDLRVSTLPTQYGEKVVVRVLSSDNHRMAIGDLGLVPEDLTDLLDVIRQPQGMLIVSGPTGSGKTTTLYGLLTEISTRRTNIVTLEDPIEYVLPGVNQVQINEKAGLTFAKCLRSVLRQDPNVIFVGEIRDAETAEIAMRASLTGHLVFTTVHASSALGTITRLVDLGVDPALIASSVTAVLGQRLLRRICEKCRDAVTPEARQLKHVEELLGEEVNFLFYRGRGCSDCTQTGYRGRTAAYELLRLNPSIRQLIHQAVVSEGNLLASARQSGMRTMLQDALSKVRQGITSLDEIERVLRIAPEFDAPVRRVCPGCEQPLEEEWKSCPFCSEGLGGAKQRRAGAPRQDANTAKDRTPAGRDVRILLVDDEVEMLHAFVMVLLQNGFSVQLARHGEEALRLVEENKPDLVIADLIMPVMGGIELITRIRGNPATRSIPIIVLSQRGDLEDRLKGFEAGIDDYIAKPFSFQEMLFRSKAILRRAHNLEGRSDVQQNTHCG